MVYLFEMDLLIWYVYAIKHKSSKFQYAMAQVYLVRERGATEGVLAAMKYITVSSSDSSWSKYVDREVNALRTLESNPHVINLHGVYENVGS